MYVSLFFPCLDMFANGCLSNSLTCIPQEYPFPSSTPQYPSWYIYPCIHCSYETDPFLRRHCSGASRRHTSFLSLPVFASHAWTFFYHRTFCLHRFSIECTNTFLLLIILPPLPTSN
ncbi:hypothetical protein F5050DRAFT_1733320 [Lentinula boryana]|uniref:Secreted protein n=1 Tax=Lentinula boryana TaxID=40481 RepID=A0ABQ8QNU6_9AGAR|nr:hypothetical protein F5050DRAFT_1733320 [Lentinula boryana]